MDDDQVFSQVLGHISSHIRGRGAGPKPVSSSTRAREKEEDNPRDKWLMQGEKRMRQIRRLKVCKAKLI